MPRVVVTFELHTPEGGIRTLQHTLTLQPGTDTFTATEAAANRVRFAIGPKRLQRSASYPQIYMFGVKGQQIPDHPKELPREYYGA